MIEISPKKQIIYEMAAALFHQKGYAATSMRELARSVNLEVSSLYSHIKSKEEILQKICFDTANQFVVSMEENISSVDSPKNKIKALIDLHLDIALKDKTAYFVFTDEWKHMSEPRLSEFIQMRKRYETHFIQLIDEGKRDGEFKNIDAKIVVNTLISATYWVHRYHMAGKKKEKSKLKKSIMRLLMGGLMKSKK